MVEAIEYVLEQADNKAGDYTIEYESFDDAIASTGNWDEALCASNARTYADDESIVGVIGTYNSGCAAIIIPILNEAGVAMVSPANTYAGLTHAAPGTEPGEPDKYYPTGTRNYARVVASDDYQGKVGASYMKDELGVTSVYILDDRELYGKGVADAFEESAETIGLTVAGHEGWDKDAPNYTALMTKIKASGADGVYIGGVSPNNGGQLVKDKVAVLGDNEAVKLLVSDGFVLDSLFTDAGAENVERRLRHRTDAAARASSPGRGGVRRRASRRRSEPTRTSRSTPSTRRPRRRSCSTQSRARTGRGRTSSRRCSRRTSPTPRPETCRSTPMEIRLPAPNSCSRQTVRRRSGSGTSPWRSNSASRITTDRGGGRGNPPPALQLTEIPAPSPVAARRLPPTSDLLRWIFGALILFGARLLADHVGDRRAAALRPGHGDRDVQRDDLRAHRARVHARLRDHRADQLRPRRHLHARDAPDPVDLRRRVGPDPAPLLHDLDPARRSRDGRLLRAEKTYAIALALVASVAFCLAINMAIERIGYKPLRNQPRLAPLITAIGFSFILQGIGLAWKGEGRIAIPQIIPNTVLVGENGTLLDFGDYPYYTVRDLMVLLITIPVLLALIVLVQRTRPGKAMRATAQDRDASAMMGISVDRTISFTFALGGAIAGAGAVVYALYVGTTASSSGSGSACSRSRPPSSVGSATSAGPSSAACCIGLISAYNDGFGDARWTYTVVFAILILILVLRPSGLLGERTPEGQ